MLLSLCTKLSKQHMLNIKYKEFGFCIFVFKFIIEQLADVHTKPPSKKTL